ncbi:hypothetical protein HCJ66_15205 [Listeria sp. FSL L7-1582]|uniref:hypothetical protein n=1 Tax=Listeria portnoyi TaxID=2713504 RepID=UPI00164EBB6B|nr:hypothetical protein [Listeria portnoyi]MBC6310884.1 hypothetical protein [Listeria portnoyi]
MEYTITRQKNIFRVSDKVEVMNVKEYSEWLQIKLNFNMKLVNKWTKNVHDAYSTALILPFYIDQDDSWDGAIYRQISATLGQYTSIPEDVFKSIFSLSTLEMKELQNCLTNSIKEKNASESTITNFFKIVKEYKEEHLNTPSVTKIDKVALNYDIDKYLRMLNDYNEQATRYKVQLLNKQESLDLQKQELSELEQLLKMNKSRYRSIEGECKYCHSNLTTEKSLTRLNLSNNFFEISLLKEIVEKNIRNLTIEVSDFRAQQNLIESKVDEISSRIQKSKELLTIDEYVKATAKNEAVNEMESLIDKQVVLKSSLEEEIKDLRKKINDLDKEKKELKESINKTYATLQYEIKMILTDTDMDELKFLEFKKIAGSGMDKNKKYLAYYLVYFNLLRKFGSYEIPFCMDSFIKNEISEDNAKQMFSAIEEFFFSDHTQSFFSIVSENLKYLKYQDSYKKVKVDGKILSEERYKDISLRFKLDN